MLFMLCSIGNVFIAGNGVSRFLYRVPLLLISAFTLNRGNYFTEHILSPCVVPECERACVLL